MEMKSCIIIIFFCSSFAFPQNTLPVFNSPPEIKSFADFLFCSGDYFRASLEYEKYLNIVPDDTVSFKTALGYSYTGNYNQAEPILIKLKESSSLKNIAESEYYKTFFYRENYNEMISAYSSPPQSDNPASVKLYYSAFLLGDLPLPAENDYRNAYTENENEMMRFYDRKKDPGYKSPFTAGLLSALLPGAGKFYTGRYGDGITALLSTGILSFLSYDNFRASHKFRGWLFAGLASLFYAGNIYGSAASAFDYNTRIDAVFKNDVKTYLQEVNYFTVEYEFCR
jgi:TM2 domain-containing membrane protein YozV